LKWKQIDIYYFTGTGNTYLAAETLAAVFRENDGCEVFLRKIEKFQDSDIILSNPIGIAFPVACWNTFPIVKDFIEKLPNGNGTNVFLLATMGDSSLKCVQNFAMILKRKGYDIIGVEAFPMPNNFIAVRSESKNEIKREKAYKKIKIYAEKLLEGKSNFDEPNIFFKNLFLFTSFVTNCWEKKFFQKLFGFKVDKSKCGKCRICADICPRTNIFMKEREYPKFEKRCQFCMRCISYCPNNAIRAFFIRKFYAPLKWGDFIK
jgi:ferredoxin